MDLDIRTGIKVKIQKKKSITFPNLVKNEHICTKNNQKQHQIKVKNSDDKDTKANTPNNTEIAKNPSKKNFKNFVENTRLEDESRSVTSYEESFIDLRENSEDDLHNFALWVRREYFEDEESDHYSCSSFQSDIHEKVKIGNSAEKGGVRVFLANGIKNKFKSF